MSHIGGIWKRRIHQSADCVSLSHLLHRPQAFHHLVPSPPWTRSRACLKDLDLWPDSGTGQLRAEDGGHVTLSHTRLPKWTDHTKQAKGAYSIRPHRIHPSRPGGSGRKRSLLRWRCFHTSTFAPCSGCFQNKKAPNQMRLDIPWGRNTDRGTTIGEITLTYLSPPQACNLLELRGHVFYAAVTQHWPLDTVHTHYAWTG